MIALATTIIDKRRLVWAVLPVWLRSSLAAIGLITAIVNAIDARLVDGQRWAILCGCCAISQVDEAAD